MNRRTFLRLGALGVPVMAAQSTRAANGDDAHPLADVCVYGGTASGVMASVAAAREGCSVIIVEPSRWLGGMTGGGISHIDWGRKEAVGGSTLGILQQDLDNAQYRATFRKMIEDNGIQVIYEHRLHSVLRDGAAIKSISLDYAPPNDIGCPPPEAIQVASRSVSANVFIDCSYEGDLMAASGIPYTFGREATSQYDESLAGVRPALWTYDIDPYVKPGAPGSGLLPYVQDLNIGPLGSADKLTMGYCFRFKFDLSGNGIPITPTDSYDPANFELWRRGFKQGIDLLRSRQMRVLGEIDERDGQVLRDGTGNMNRSLLNTAVYGSNKDYPDGNWEARSAIWQMHQDFFRDLVHFLRTDPAVPAEQRERAS
ncbi:MAG: FAD-dependent oxidoreductase, partial [Planctomycetales bacterium]|nr:FAD-dependent oxidoreductase [Planctomycetales bacterium]